MVSRPSLRTPNDWRQFIAAQGYSGDRIDQILADWDKDRAARFAEGIAEGRRLEKQPDYKCESCGLVLRLDVVPRATIACPDCKMHSAKPMEPAHD